MVIKNVFTDGYKNLSDIDISLDPHMNIFCGENAQGKTNLIEAIWLCSGCRSFRSTRDKDFIGFTKDFADVRLSFKDSFRSQDIRFVVKKGAVKDKLVTLNGVKLSLLSKLFGQFCCVVFTPEDLELSKGSPDNRRSFIDLSIAQIKPSYVNALNTYNNILSQRNAFLKTLYNNPSADKTMLDIWDEQLAKAGAYISVLRYIFCNNLNNYTNKLYNNITNSKEKLNLYYTSTVFKEIPEDVNANNELTDIYLARLKKNINDDIRAGFTTVGIHRDDVITEINGLSVRDFGSQGQARSVALVMKLAHAQILSAEKGDAPVMLLDDVLSELDINRQRFILNNINDMQVLITCCDEKFISEMTGGKVFHVEDGKITEEKEGT